MNELFEVGCGVRVAQEMRARGARAYRYTDGDDDGVVHIKRQDTRDMDALIHREESLATVRLLSDEDAWTEFSYAAQRARV